MAKEPVEIICHECKKPFVTDVTYKITAAKQGLRAYCSKACSKEFVRRSSSKTMARTNRKYASDRMKKKNPMSIPGMRERVSKTMKERGHQPKIRGGNGRPATKAEAKLVEIFGSLGFQEQCIVPTRTGRGNGYPTHYKIDCGNEGLKIGIETDGRSHNAPDRREQDARKDRFLTERGWRMFRFTNDVILGQPDYVFETVLAAILERH